MHSLALSCVALQGRHTKSKARVTAYERMVEEAETARSRDRFMSGAIVIPPAPRLGEAALRLVDAPARWHRCAVPMRSPLRTCVQATSCLCGLQATSSCARGASARRSTGAR